MMLESFSCNEGSIATPLLHFFDAMELVSSFQLGGNGAQDTKIPVQVDVDELIERAQDRLIVSEIFPSSYLTRTYTLRMEDIKTDHDLETVTTLSDQDVGSIVFLIGKASFKENSLRTAFFSAVCMYNYGIARELYANVLPHQQRNDIHLRHLRESRLWIKRADAVLKKLALASVGKNHSNRSSYSILAVRLVVLSYIHEQVVGTKSQEKVTRKLDNVSTQLNRINSTRILEKNCDSAMAA